MTEIGEGIAIPLERLAQGKCVFCGKKEHENIKKDEIKPTGWTRAAISGVGGNFIGKKLAIYPGGISPPVAYRSEGHHCLAFSSFIVDARTAPKDRFAALNHYLKDESYSPNNPNNTIDLPGRKLEGDMDKHAQFKEYEKSVLAGKPMQLHIGGHKSEFMNASNVVIRDIVRSMQDELICEKPDDAFKKELLNEIKIEEDKAFRKTAGVITPWIAHPGPLAKAEAYVKNTHNISNIKYPVL